MKLQRVFVRYVCACVILLCVLISLLHIQAVYQVQIVQSDSRTRGTYIPFTIRTRFPVDLVYTWVNGTDQKHKENLHRLIQNLKKNKSHTATRARNLRTNRFADNDALRYSLRSVEKYANWIRHVFIVTNGQVPRWLDVRHPRVKIVKHTEIFDDPEDLPTFSSCAIEHNIFKIKGLSERFLYMNDDVFFGQNVTLEDFYTEENGTKIVLTSWMASTVCDDHCSTGLIRNGVCDTACNYDHCAWDGGDCDNFSEEFRPKDDGKSHCDYSTSIFFTNALYNRAFGSRNRKVPAHCPLFITKSVLQDIIQRFPNEVRATVKHRFRSPLDFQYQFSYAYFLMEAPNCSHRVEALTSSWMFSFVSLSANEEKTRKELDMLKKTKKKFICINDDIDYTMTLEAQVTVDLLHEFYETMFPKMSSFEIRSF